MDWDTPRWRQEGRTGPHGPKYKKLRDREKVRRGGKPGGPPQKGECCPMVAALRSARRRKFRLARRYAVMSARLVAARA